MKQKIVVKVQICCDKCRQKAMKIAASAEGVISVTIQGDDKDEIVVVGVRVDSVGLCTTLRKKLGHANLKSIEEMKDPKPEEKKKEEQSAEKKSEEEKKPDKEEKKKKEEKKDEKQEGKKSESEPAAAAAPAEAAVLYHHYPPLTYNYPPPNYCYPNPNPPQCYVYTTHYEDNPNCAIM